MKKASTLLPPGPRTLTVTEQEAMDASWNRGIRQKEKQDVYRQSLEQAAQTGCTISILGDLGMENLDLNSLKKHHHQQK